MMTDYNKRQADWAKREQAKEDDERKGEVKVGEVFGKATGDIRKDDDIKVRIDNVETLRFRPPGDLKEGDSIRITIKADWTKRDQERQGWGRESVVQPSEASGKATGDIRKTDDVRVRMDNVETLRFKPTEDLKKGDSIRITIEKV
ncbi:hypothetical protein ACFLYN_04180 [Chloroflexota bacterium]